MNAPVLLGLGLIGVGGFVVAAPAIFFLGGAWSALVSAQYVTTAGYVMAGSGCIALIYGVFFL
jgi:hypothetical protein